MAGLLTTPSPPIFVVDRGSGDVVWAFSDPQAAQGAMEPPEVNEDAYLVFDCRGHIATLGVERFDTKIQGWSPEPDADRLRYVLTRFLVTHGRNVHVSVRLDDLVNEANKLATEVEYARTHPRILVPLLKWWRRRETGSA